MATGAVTTLAGSGAKGFRDGAGGSAQFHYPTGVAVDGEGNVYICCEWSNAIRKIDAHSGRGGARTASGMTAPGS